MHINNLLENKSDKYQNIFNVYIVYSLNLQIGVNLNLILC